MTWNERFTELFETCLQKYRGGNPDYKTYYSEDDLEFLLNN